GSNFPTSNLAMFNSADSSIAYLHNDSTGLFIQGIYAKINGWRVVHMTPSQEVCVFPATYGSTFSNASTLEFDMPYTSQPGVDSVRIKQTTVKNVTFDGWGSITTPLGTFNTLRNRGKVNTIDTIWAHIPTLSSWMQVSATNDSVWHFAWWAHNVGFSILEFDSTAADTLKNVDWLKVLPINNAVNELSFINGVSVYPNPASANVNFEIKNSKASTIELYNLTGEKISTVDVKRMNNTSFNVENFAPGVYFYTAIDMEGIPFARGKINVVR
ncbi:MAG TPA: T9SS type A sorting domain-containing protein, partial [Bacteroidia bacterium]